MFYLALIWPVSILLTALAFLSKNGRKYFFLSYIFWTSNYRRSTSTNFTFVLQRVIEIFTVVLLGVDMARIYSLDYFGVLKRECQEISFLKLHILNKWLKEIYQHKFHFCSWKCNWDPPNPPSKTLLKWKPQDFLFLKFQSMFQ